MPSKQGSISNEPFKNNTVNSDSNNNFINKTHNNSNVFDMMKKKSHSVLSMLDPDLNMSRQSNGALPSVNQTLNNLIHKLAKTEEIKGSKKKVVVTTRVVFLKVGQIDTINERYDANIYIESSWEDDVIFKVLADPQMSAHVTNDEKFAEFIKQKADKLMNSDTLANLKNIINNINLLEYDPVRIFLFPKF
jgi:hypothetical protein